MVFKHFILLSFFWVPSAHANLFSGFNTVVADILQAPQPSRFVVSFPKMTSTVTDLLEKYLNQEPELQAHKKDLKQEDHEITYLGRKPADSEVEKYTVFKNQKNKLSLADFGQYIFLKAKLALYENMPWIKTIIVASDPHNKNHQKDIFKIPGIRKFSDSDSDSDSGDAQASASAAASASSSSRRLTEADTLNANCHEFIDIVSKKYCTAMKELARERRSKENRLKFNYFDVEHAAIRASTCLLLRIGMIVPAEPLLKAVYDKFNKNREEIKANQIAAGMTDNDFLQKSEVERQFICTSTLTFHMRILFEMAAQVGNYDALQWIAKEHPEALKVVRPGVRNDSAVQCALNRLHYRQDSHETVDQTIISEINKFLLALQQKEKEEKEVPLGVAADVVAHQYCQNMESLANKRRETKTRLAFGTGSNMFNIMQEAKDVKAEAFLNTSNEVSTDLLLQAVTRNFNGNYEEIRANTMARLFSTSELSEKSESERAFIRTSTLTLHMRILFETAARLGKYDVLDWIQKNHPAALKVERPNVRKDSAIFYAHALFMANRKNLKIEPETLKKCEELLSRLMKENTSAPQDSSAAAASASDLALDF